MRAIPITVIAIAAAAGARRSWLRSMHADVEWLAGKHTAFPGPGKALAQWWDQAKVAPKLFAKHCKHVLFDAQHNRVQAWARTRTMEQLAHVHACPDCGRRFESRQAHAAHRFAQRRDLRVRADGAYPLNSMYYPINLSLEAKGQG